jgi:hypothetical protein
MFGEWMELRSFEQIKEAIARPEHKPVGDKLTVSHAPEPFVAPRFEVAQGQTGILREIVLIRASAAVGKSTIAKALSAARDVPVLDLSSTAVATGSLKGLLSDLRNGTNPVDAFHEGKLPIIVDALDEGRIRSSENGFISFLESSAETVLESRAVKDSPKLILLGRPEAIEWALLAFSRDDIEVSVLDVGYFDEEGARALIHAYAEQAAKPDSGYLIHREPAEQLISTYFEKIEAALGLKNGQLWTSENGPSFAGYAPVLAAIGSLLPEIDNFAEARNRLNETGSADAWGVIESVLDAIIERERGKLINLIGPGMLKPLPDNAYDREEQLTLLLQHVEGEPLTGTGRVKLSPADMAKYDDEIKRWLPEHPFLRNGDLSNDVIASFVFAPAIAADRRINKWGRLHALSRQPFLWRSLAPVLDAATLIDGKYVGLMLNSFWSDPLTRSDMLIIQAIDEGSATVSVRSGDDVTEFQATSPIILHGQLKNGEIDVAGGLILEGAGSDPLAKTFSLESVVVRSTAPITLNASKLRLSGRVWLDSDFVATGGQLSLELGPDSSYGWGAALKDKYPFNRHSPTLEDPDRSDSGTLEGLLGQCAKRFPAGAALALNADYSAPEGDPHTRWTTHRYQREFPLLIGFLVKHGFADTNAMDARGSTGKIRLRLKESMEAIKDGILGGDARFGELARDLRAEIPD